jgi:hypothetical protein
METVNTEINKNDNIIKNVEEILNKPTEKIEEIKATKKATKSKYDFDKLNKDAKKPEAKEGYTWKY